MIKLKSLFGLAIVLLFSSSMLMGFQNCGRGFQVLNDVSSNNDILKSTSSLALASSGGAMNTVLESCEPNQGWICMDEPLIPRDTTVGAWYSVYWYAKGSQLDHWAEWTRYEPTLGYYDSGDIIKQQEPYFERAGINYLILDHTNGWNNDGGRIIAELQAAGELLALGGAGRQRWVHVAALDSLGERVIGLLSAWHDHEPLRSRFFQAQVESALAGEITADLLAQAISRMVSAGKLQQTAGCLNVTGRGAKLTRNENLLFAELIERFRTAGLATPTVEEFRAQATKAQPSVGQLFELAAADGLLVKITAEYFLHAEVERAARETVAARLTSGPLTTSEIRELLQTSRKFALPLCEYWDRSGFTRRQGDLRVLAGG